LRSGSTSQLNVYRTVIHRIFIFAKLKIVDVIYCMTNEFERRIESLILDEETRITVKNLIVEAGKDFPCLNCTSKDECENFKWFVKWFGS